MQRARTTGEALVELLEAYGVDTVFGVPGVHTVDLYRGLVGAGMRHVLPRHEQAAGFMADGYARACGRPAACFVITGPGVTNIATAVGQANSDSVPMLVVATAVDRSDLGLARGRLHEIPRQRELCRTVAGFAETALASPAVPELIARAFAGWRVGRPRPAVIELPLDVVAAPAEGPWQAVALPEPPRAPQAQIVAAARFLAAAHAPAVLFGGGSRHLGRCALDLIERLGAPAVTTVAAKGVVPDSHPLSLGATLACEATREFLRQRDRILVLGSELAETDFWLDWLPLQGRMARVDIDPERLADPRYPTDIAIFSDTRMFVEALLPLLPEHRAGELDLLKRVRGAAVGEADELARLHRGVLDVVHDNLPGGAVVCADMTQIAYAGNVAFRCEQPGRWFHPVGFGTLGWALPAAIGAALARPGQPVVALLGDYGFQYTAAELATAVELELPLIVLLWNNEALGQIRDDMRRRRMPPLATSLRNPDFVRLATAMGARATRVDAPGGLAAALRDALEHRRPSLIEIPEAVMARAFGLPADR